MHSMADRTQSDFFVGEWRVHPAECRLSRDGRTVAVRPKVMDLLVYLAQTAGQVTSKDTLLNDVWGTDAVSESALTRTVTELRQALDDSANSPRILETIPKRGYRLIAAVVPADREEPSRAGARAVNVVARPYASTAALLTLIVIALTAGSWQARGLPWRTTPLPFSARDWVLIAPFENRTGDPAFDDVLEQALERELVGSAFVKVVPRPRIEDSLALMKKPPDVRLDAALAREVALRDGDIRALLTGRISRVGSTYVVSTTIVNPVDGGTVANIAHDASGPAVVVQVVRRQALDVRRALGETMASVDRSRDALAKVTTPSLRALQLYSRAAVLLGGEAWRDQAKGKSPYAAAEVLLKEATAIDPSFASAWLLLAHAVGQQDRPATEHMPFAERALGLSSAVSPVERYFIEGFTHTRRGYRSEQRQDYDAAAKAYEGLLQLAPDHYWTLTELLVVYRRLGRFDDAERIVADAAAVRPRSIRFAIDAARAHLRRGDRQLAQATMQHARALIAEAVANSEALPVDSLEWLRLWDAHVAWLDGDPERALLVANQAEERWASDQSIPWLFKLAAVYSGIGRYDDARRVADRLPEDRRGPLIDSIAFQRGRLGEIRHVLEPKRLDSNLLGSRIALLIWANKFSAAEWALAETRRRDVRFTTDALVDRLGQLRVRQGRYAEGLAMLESIKPDPMGPRYNVVEHIAMGRRGLGDTAGAIKLLERAGLTRVQAVTHDGWQVSSWLKCRTLLAELYQEGGRQSDAERVAMDLRNLLRLAEADHPLLVRASRVMAPGSTSFVRATAIERRAAQDLAAPRVAARVFRQP
jgi:DNA-binding winged helix-turn-helix (wHTH) protein/tetratricopeptide (TPR) repeat protein